VTKEMIQIEGLDIEARGNTISIKLSHKKWLKHYIDDTFSAIRVEAVEKQIKNNRRAQSIISYAVCVYGTRSNIQGKVMLFIIFKNKYAPTIVVSDFMPDDNERVVIGARRKASDNEDERESKRTKYDAFIEDEYEDYMQDVETEYIDTFNNAPQDIWSHVLSFLTHEDILHTSVSHIMRHAALQHINGKHEDQYLVLCAGTGKPKTLKELLKNSNISDSDVFTFALREAIQNKHPKCALALLKDGRADPYYNFQDVTNVYKVRMLQDSYEGKMQTISEEDTHKFLHIASLVDGIPLLPDYEEDIYPTQEHILTYGNQEFDDLLSEPKDLSLCNALLHASIQNQPKVIQYLIKNRTWSNYMAKYALCIVGSAEHFPSRLFLQIIDKYNIKDLLWAMSLAFSREDDTLVFTSHLFIVIFDRISSEYLTEDNIEEFSDLISATLNYDCEIVDCLIESNWKGMSQPLIKQCAAILFSGLLSKNRVDLLELTKELGEEDITCDILKECIHQDIRKKQERRDYYRFMISELTKKTPEFYPYSAITKLLIKTSTVLEVALELDVFDALIMLQAACKEPSIEKAEIIIAYATQKNCTLKWIHKLLTMPSIERLPGCRGPPLMMLLRTKTSDIIKECLVFIQKMVVNDSEYCEEMNVLVTDGCIMDYALKFNLAQKCIAVIDFYKKYNRDILEYKSGDTLWDSKRTEQAHQILMEGWRKIRERFAHTLK
jgi:hypothetical protein